jgi:kynurenine formamidase
MSTESKLSGHGLKQSQSIIDLTLLVAEELPCAWSSHVPYQQRTYNYFADNTKRAEAPLFSRVGPYQTRTLVIDEHTGTHFDAPAHFIPEPSTGLPHAGEAGHTYANMVSLDQLSGPAAVIDVPADLPGGANGVSPIIPVSVVEDFEKKHGRLQPNDVVLFRSNWDRFYLPGEPGKKYNYGPMILKSDHGWPAPDVEVMQLLLDRGIRCIGTDGSSMGPVHNGAPVHQLALSTGAVFIESLANLKKLPDRGSWFMFAPLNLARGTGAPGRAFAIVENNGNGVS